MSSLSDADTRALIGLIKQTASTLGHELDDKTIEAEVKRQATNPDMVAKARKLASQGGGGVQGFALAARTDRDDTQGLAPF